MLSWPASSTSHAPRPELLALPDPHDPVHSAPYRLHDVTLYDGKYYLYWGPVLGLFHAAWKGLTGRPASSTLVLALGGWALPLVLDATHAARPGIRHVPAWSVGLLSLCYALGGVGPYLQACRLSTTRRSSGPASSCWGASTGGCEGLDGTEGAIWKLALAGMFGCAVGSRTTVILYPLVAGLHSQSPGCGSPAAPGGRSAGPWHSVFPSAPRWPPCAVQPARFGSPFEFGQPVGFGGASRG